MPHMLLVSLSPCLVVFVSLLVSLSSCLPVFLSPCLLVFVCLLVSLSPCLLVSLSPCLLVLLGLRPDARLLLVVHGRRFFLVGQGSRDNLLHFVRRPLERAAQ